MEKYEISVIIPCYNCEDTISRCIKSVINQTLGFEKIELILVDDKSKDNTKKIIEYFSGKYENIKPIYLKENSGYPGKPRNIGIQNATADYIMFMDNDDEYDHEICEKLYKEIKQENADMATCNFINIDSMNSIHYEFEFKNGKELDDKIIIEDEGINYFKIDVIWCNIFKKSLIINNNIKFPENKLYEDGYFMINIILNTNKLIYLNKYYGYLRHSHRDSTLHTINIEKHMDAYDVLEETIELFPKDYDLSYRFKTNILHAYTRLLTTNLISSDPKGTYNFLKKINKIENKINFNEKLMMPFNIINWFVMRENYKTAFFLLKTIYIYIKINSSLNYIGNFILINKRSVFNE